MKITDVGETRMTVVRDIYQQSIGMGVEQIVERERFDQLAWHHEAG
jgi:hypothetical protein